MERFTDRTTAGTLLAARLRDFDELKDVIVVGLPRGGVIVAAEVARVLSLPVRAVVAKKITAPGNPEVAIGAIAGGMRIVDERAAAAFNVTPEYLAGAGSLALKEAERREALFCPDKHFFSYEHKTAIVVDDGVATGATMVAAIALLRSRNAQEIVVAVPAAARDAYVKLQALADRIECLVISDSPMFGVGALYEHFPQVADTEVLAALGRH